MKIQRAAMMFGLTVACALGGALQADAGFIAYLCNDMTCSGGGDIVVADQGAGDDSPVVGVIIAQGVVGGLTTSVNVAQSKPVLGSAATPQLDLGFVATGIGDVWLYASDTDFTGVTALRLQAGGTSTSAPIHVDVFAGGGSSNTNLTPGVGFVAGLGPFNGSPFTGESVSGIVGSAVIPYSLTLGVHIVQNGDTTTGDANLETQVPEPASALLLGLGLGMLGLVGLVRRRP